MPPRRVYADLEPRRDEEELLEAEELLEEVEQSAPADSPRSRMAAIQRSAGNAATGRLLRDATAAPPVDMATAARRHFEQVRRETGFLVASIVPEMLDRLAPHGQNHTTETLAELTLMARVELERHLNAIRQPWEAPVRIASPLDEIQRAVAEVAGQRALHVPGHRDATDAAGLVKEAKALATLSGLNLPDLAIEASAGGFTFRFDGELSAKGRIGGAAVTAKGGAEGGEAGVKAGPVSGGASVGKDGAKVKVKVGEGAVELKGDITAKPDGRTTWSVGLEVKLGGGAAPAPDPAALAGMIEKAGGNVVSAAEYLGAAVSGSAEIDKGAIEGKLKPAAESIGKVKDYIEKNKARPAGRPGATVGVNAKGTEAGGVTAMITLTITF